MNARKIVLIVLTMILSISYISAQSTFIRTFGNRIPDHFNFGYSVLETEDKGYLLSGEMDFYFFYDQGLELYGNAFMIRTDSSGQMQWQKIFGDSSSRQYFRSVKQNYNSGFIASGFDYRKYKLWIVNTDYKGDTLWTKYYDSLACGSCIERTNDSNYVIIGPAWDFYGKLYMIKIDNEGNLLWLKTYEGSGNNFYDVKQTSDQGYIIAGTNDENFWIIKTDPNGDTTWTRTFGSKYTDVPQSLLGFEDGYIISGTYTDSISHLGGLVSHIQLLKLDLSGNIIWEKKIAIGIDDVITSSLRFANGNLLIAGRSWHSQADMLILKLNNNGDVIWSKIYGNDIFSDSLSSEENYMLTIQDMIFSSDSCLVIAGSRSLNTLDIYDIFLIKLDERGNITSTVTIQYPINSYILHQNFPNPFNPITTIPFEVRESSYVTLQIFDITGRLVTTLVDGYKEAGNWDVTWNAGNYSSGIYIYRLQYGEKHISREMLLMK